MLCCERSADRYEILNGIPIFLSGEPVEDKQTHNTLVRLNRIAKEKNWHDALLEVYGAESGMLRYVTERKRALFLDLLALSKESVVLEIGPGLGQFTPLIAKRVKRVYGLEVVAGQAEFAFERCRQEGANNVQIACGGDDCRLPYPDCTMDVVIMNLVFEWCSTRNKHEPANQGQKRMLGEIFRVLRAGGRLYLSTKNRFALRYLIGKRDEHSYSIRFGNALPRVLHNIILRLSGHQRPEGVLHSHSKLRSMLMEAGYVRPRSYWATPEMRFPEHYIPTDAPSIRKARSKANFPQGDMRSVNLLMPLIPAVMVKHFTSGLTFIASKPPI